MKKVLIALDYDPTAQKIAEAGFSLATGLGAETILLHVISDTTYYSVFEYSDIEGYMGFNKTEASHLFDSGLKKAMIQFLNKSKKHLGNEKITTLVEEGLFAETIVKTAISQKVDVLVLGSHSKKWLENIVMGSVTEKVLQLSTIPLYIIPTKKRS